MSTKYPIILVHGVAAKQARIMNAFGRIGDELSLAGYDVFIADTDGFGRIETNAQQLKCFIDGVIAETEADKVNIIAHSKGGLDSKYMIEHLGMEDRVASLTTLCTPHKGSIIASWIWTLPMPIKKCIAGIINRFYKKFLDDVYPDAMATCEQLRYVDESVETVAFSAKVYCQSYSASVRRVRDCFVMALPMTFYRHFGKQESDGLVSVESAKFENYKGDCLDIPISHVQIIDLFPQKSKRERVYAFYKSLCSDLSEMGF